MDPKKMTPEQRKLQEAKAPPAPNPITVADKITKTRNDLGLYFKEFQQLIKDKVLDKYKSIAQKNTEKQTVDNLYKTAIALEQQNVSEGVFAVGMIGLRLLLGMRDRINELEYELYSSKKDIKKLKEKLGMKDDDEPKGKAGST